MDRNIVQIYCFICNKYINVKLKIRLLNQKSFSLTEKVLKYKEHKNTSLQERFLKKKQ